MRLAGSSLLALRAPCAKSRCLGELASPRPLERGRGGSASSLDAAAPLARGRGHGAQGEGAGEEGGEEVPPQPLKSSKKSKNRQTFPKFLGEGPPVGARRRTRTSRWPRRRSRRPRPRSRRPRPRRRLSPPRPVTRHSGGLPTTRSTAFCGGRLAVRAPLWGSRGALFACRPVPGRFTEGSRRLRDDVPAASAERGVPLSVRLPPRGLRCVARPRQRRRPRPRRPKRRTGTWPWRRPALEHAGPTRRSANGLARHDCCRMVFPSLLLHFLSLIHI